MIILHKGTEEHRDAGTSAPQGEPGTPPSVLTPQSPCTATRAVGVGTLYRDTIYAATAKTKLMATGVHTHTHCRGFITSVGSGHLPKGCMRARGLACVQACSGAAPASCNRCGCGWAYVGRAHHGRAGHPYAHINPHGQEEDNENTKDSTI